MSASVTVTVTIPTSDRQHIERMWIHRALHIAAQQIRAAAGNATTGNMTDAGTDLGSWSYTPGASS